MILIITFVLGIVGGIYISSQIEKSIEKNIKQYEDSGQLWIRKVFASPPPKKCQRGIVKYIYNSLFKKNNKYDQLYRR